MHNFTLSSNMLAMNLSVSLEAKLRAVAQLHGKSPADMAAEALEYWLEVDDWAACRASGHQLNAETIKAIEESRQGDGLKAYSSPADLFKDRDCHIEFINLVVAYLTENGVTEPDRLYESPFTDINSQGPEGVFPLSLTTPQTTQERSSVISIGI